MQKGVSEVIASIALVSLAVFLGLLTTTWYVNIASKEQRETGCIGGVNYIIESAKYNSGTSALQIKLTNFGDSPLYGFGVILSNSTETIQIKSSKTFENGGIDQGSITNSSKLMKGQSVYIRVNMSDYGALGPTLREVIVTNDACPLNIRTGSIENS